MRTRQQRVSKRILEQRKVANGGGVVRKQSISHMTRKKVRVIVVRVIYINSNVWKIFKAKQKASG